MTRIEVRITSASPHGLPAYQTEGSSGCDVRAHLPETLVIGPGETVSVPTGLSVACPEGFECQLRSRSGLASRGISLANGVGTIDPDYRGEIRILLVNRSAGPFPVHDGDRIAQMVFCPVVRAEFIRVDALDPTGRQDGGFGHTGLN